MNKTTADEKKSFLGKRSKWLTNGDITLEELGENLADLRKDMDEVLNLLQAIAEVVGCTDLLEEPDDEEIWYDQN